MIGPPPPPPPPKKKDRARTPRPRGRSSAERLGHVATEPAALEALQVHDARPTRDSPPAAPGFVPPAPGPAPISPLRVAVWESHGHLAAAQLAVIAAGHLVVGGGAGIEGLAAITTLVREGACDVLLVALTPVAPGAPVHDGAPGDAAGGLLAAALALATRRPVLVASVAGGLALGARRAAAAGADLVLARPHDVDKLAPVLLAAARLATERHALAAARGAEATLRARLDQVAHTEPGSLEPFERFQRALELEIKRARRYAYPLAVALFAVEVARPPPPTGVRGILRARIGTALVRAIRDIDLATQLDHERFLVLLPYTDLAGAASVGQRVIAAVASGDAVSAAGRTFPLHVTGAVAGASPGEPLSFSRLMRDATRALEHARREVT